MVVLISDSITSTTEYNELLDSIKGPLASGRLRVDLLFYHCRLHRYVVFEWKLGRFEPEHVGKLNFYVHSSPTTCATKAATIQPWACS